MENVFETLSDEEPDLMGDFHLDRIDEDLVETRGRGRGARWRQARGSR